MRLTATAVLVVFGSMLGVLETWSLSMYWDSFFQVAVSAITAFLYGAGLQRGLVRRHPLARRGGVRAVGPIGPVID